MRSLRLRLIVAATLWCVIGLAVGGYVLSTLFADYVNRNLDNRLVTLLEAVVAGSGSIVEGQVSLLRPPSDARFEQPYSGLYWQIDGAAGPVGRSRSLWDQALPTAASLPLLRDVAGPNDQRLRVAARWLTLPQVADRHLFQLAADRAESEAEVARFNRLLAWGLGAIGLGLLLALVLQVRLALRPLDAMRRTLADIRAGRAARLDGDFPTEVAPLAGELNALLAHNDSVLERARTQAGNLAHALKTPLAILTNEASAAGGPLAELVARQADDMRRQVDRQLARARAAGAAGTLRGRTEPAPVIDGLLRAMARLHAGRDLQLDSDCADAPAFAGERQDLEEMLGNLLDNACKWARRRVHIAARRDGDRLCITVDDDGPGLEPAQRTAVMQRGIRLDENRPGSGLGLSIVVDLAELHDGDLILEQAPPGGLRARLDLPAA